MQQRRPHSTAAIDVNFDADVDVHPVAPRSRQARKAARAVNRLRRIKGRGASSSSLVKNPCVRLTAGTFALAFACVAIVLFLDRGRSGSGGPSRRPNVNLSPSVGRVGEGHAGHSHNHNRDEGGAVAMGGNGNGKKGGVAERMRGSNKNYIIPESMPLIGDKSRWYAQLRHDYDTELLPLDFDRSVAFVRAARESAGVPLQHASASTPYDIHACPETPPKGYPWQWPVLEVLDNWSPDDADAKDRIYQGVCVFDYRTELHKAANYRRAEVPFVVRDDPAVARTAERWGQKGYLERLTMGNEDTMRRAEYSHNNHFMYWQGGANKKKQKGIKEGGWTPPTENIRMTYTQWMERAGNATDANQRPNDPHWYLRLIGCGDMGDHGDCDKGHSEWLFDELTFFQPLLGERRPFYLVEPERQKGIHCRFGMRGVIAENHFDSSRNAIVVLGGRRRYILGHPGECPNMYLFPRGHPSARHSSVDWSHPDLEGFPDFGKARVNEVVMQAGDVLYLPTHWFHYIVSLGMNYQCNTRSGGGGIYSDYMEDCGF